MGRMRCGFSPSSFQPARCFGLLRQRLRNGFLGQSLACEFLYVINLEICIFALNGKFFVAMVMLVICFSFPPLSFPQPSSSHGLVLCTCKKKEKKKKEEVCSLFFFSLSFPTNILKSRRCNISSHHYCFQSPNEEYITYSKPAFGFYLFYLGYS